MTAPAAPRRLDVFWGAEDGPGVEHLQLTLGPDGIAASGTIAGVDSGGPFRARYRIVCDAGWRVRGLAVDAATPHGAPALGLSADGDGRWTTRSGDPLPALDGAVDVDLSASPSTNTLPIRRLSLAPGEAARVRVVYVRVPALTLAALDQRYTCLARTPLGGRWRYESLDAPFTAELDVDAEGLVRDYPGLFRRLWPPPPGGARPGLVVVFLIERAGEILLLRRSAAKDHAPGEWETGSGRVDPGEPPLAALVREAREETGLDIEVLGPIGARRFLRGAEREERQAITFHCRPAGGTLALSWEHDAARWVPLDQALAEDLPDGFRRSLEHLRALRRS